MSIEDSISLDPYVLETNADEEARNERWDSFREFVAQGRTSVLLRHVSDLMDGYTDPYRIYKPVQDEILGFQETEGWSGVLSVIASVQYDKEKARDEK